MPELTAPAPPRWNHSQQVSTAERLRPLAVEQLIREARAAGYDGPQRRLVRLVRSYVSARASCSFAEWLGYSDPTATTAIRRLMRAGDSRG